ncbi:hypothetical protein DSO57_1018857 [Entomophthora muscae]|uniref:Uncharacterized protein n=1 Tax=Entomophthora muscae TaxID=34485 RepID=A0ACC2UQ33_9FUNG|nr:hypothetical protein DSO57_1018857 [Entomophthora muscae]
MIACWCLGYGFRRLFPSLFLAFLFWEAYLSSHSSPALDGILVDGSTRMRARICVMNAFSDILDINLLLFKEGDLFSPSSAFEPPKGPEMASEPLFSSIGPSQSQFDNVNLNHFDVTLGDVGSIGEAGNLLCLILGPLFAVPAGVVAKTTSWSLPSVGLSTDAPSYA